MENKVLSLEKRRLELEKMKEELESVSKEAKKEVSSVGEKGSSDTFEKESTPKVLFLSKSNWFRGNKKAGYTDALMLSFIVTSFAIATLICMMIRIHMTGI